MRAQIEMLARQAGLLEPDARVGDFLAAVTNRCASDIFANLGAVRLGEYVVGLLADIVGFPSTAAGNLTSGGQYRCS